MKKLLLISFFMIYFTAQIFPQHWSNRRSKLAQLEKSKLIETLEMDEETSVRFFARRSESMNEMKKLIKKREALLDSLGSMIESENTEAGQKLLKRIYKIEKKIFSTRADFVESLKDLLPADKILKFVYFDYSFKKEMRDILLNRRKRGKGKE